MAEPVMTFAARRWILGTMTMALAAIGATLLLSLSLSLRDTAFVSGWGLVGMILFLALYNARKKLTYPPLLKSSTWLQMHLYVGLLSIVLFLFHIGLRIPNGVIEVSLALLFVGVAGTGVIGIALSRIIPGRLTIHGNEVLFERIPRYRRQLREKAEAIVVKSVEGGAMTLANFHSRRLADYFGGPCNALGQLLHPTRRVGQLQQELRAQERYLDADDVELLGELSELVAAKNDLDSHRARQGVLKLWLFVHIPLTFAMLAFIAVHMVLVHAFAGR